MSEGKSDEMRSMEESRLGRVLLRSMVEREEKRGRIGGGEVVRGEKYWPWCKGKRERLQVALFKLVDKRRAGCWLWRLKVRKKDFMCGRQ